MPKNRLMKFFASQHLPPDLRLVSMDCEALAVRMDELPESAEKTAGLRKLLEAKDCFVRAALELRDRVEDPDEKPLDDPSFEKVPWGTSPVERLQHGEDPLPHLFRHTNGVTTRASDCVECADPACSCHTYAAGLKKGRELLGDPPKPAADEDPRLRDTVLDPGGIER